MHQCEVHCWYFGTLTNRCNDEHSQGPTSHSACFRIHDQFCPWRWFALQISRQRHCPLSNNLLHEREECVLRIIVMYVSCIYSWLFFTFRPKRSTHIDGFSTPSHPCYLYVSLVCFNQRIVADHVHSQMSAFFLMLERNQLRNPSIISGKHLMWTLMLVVLVERLQLSRVKLGEVCWILLVREQLAHCLGDLLNVSLLHSRCSSLWVQDVSTTC